MVVDDAFADLFDGNERYAAVEHEVVESGVARRGLAILTCIDSRIDPLAVFGLEPGDAKILRNAGARVTDDALRTLALAAATLGVVRIAVVQHTDCAIASASDEDLVAAVAEATGRHPAGFEPLAIADQESVLRADVDVGCWPARCCETAWWWPACCSTCAQAVWRRSSNPAPADPLGRDGDVAAHGAGTDREHVLALAGVSRLWRQVGARAARHRGEVEPHEGALADAHRHVARRGTEVQRASDRRRGR